MTDVPGWGTNLVDVGWRILILTVGGACGVNARYWLGLLIARWLGSRFPWATVLINVSGSFAIGLGAVILAERYPDPLIRLLALTGFLGGYTTFSSAMFETLTLWERGDRGLALGNLVGSFVAGMIAVVLGVIVGRWVTETGFANSAHSAEVERRLEAVGDALAGHETDGPVT